MNKPRTVVVGPPLSATERTRAGRYVLGNIATDPDDALRLLDALGIDLAECRKPTSGESPR